MKTLDESRSIKSQLQFKLQFMLFMRSVGRVDETEKALRELCEMVDSMPEAV